MGGGISKSFRKYYVYGSALTMITAWFTSSEQNNVKVYQRNSQRP